MTRPATCARALMPSQDGANFSPKGKDNRYLIFSFRKDFFIFN
jgi:hypothetical protein